MPFCCAEIVSGLVQVSLVTAVCLTYIPRLFYLDIYLFLQCLLVVQSGQQATASSCQLEHYEHLYFSQVLLWPLLQTHIS